MLRLKVQYNLKQVHSNSEGGEGLQPSKAPPHTRWIRPCTNGTKSHCCSKQSWQDEKETYEPLYGMVKLIICFATKVTALDGKCSNALFTVLVSDRIYYKNVHKSLCPLTPLCI